MDDIDYFELHDMLKESKKHEDSDGVVSDWGYRIPVVIVSRKDLLEIFPEKYEETER